MKRGQRMHERAQTCSAASSSASPTHCGQGPYKAPTTIPPTARLLASDSSHVSRSQPFTYTSSPPSSRRGTVCTTIPLVSKIRRESSKFDNVSCTSRRTSRLLLPNSSIVKSTNLICFPKKKGKKTVSKKKSFDAPWWNKVGRRCRGCRP